MHSYATVRSGPLNLNVSEQGACAGVWGSSLSYAQSLGLKANSILKDRILKD